MKIKIKTFASMKEACGFSEKDLNVPPGSTTGTVLDELMTEHPNIRLSGTSILIAVNEEYAGRERVLAEGDVIALFPPVSGG